MDGQMDEKLYKLVGEDVVVADCRFGDEVIWA
jgi:hypothetical protein